MGMGFKDYVRACIGEAPSAFRRGVLAATAVTYVVLVAGLFLGWHLDALSGFQFASFAAAIAAVGILIVFPFRLWRANMTKIEDLEDRLKPKLRLAFDMNDPGCVRPHTQVKLATGDEVVATWYRVRVEAIGSTSLTNCRGRLVSIHRGVSNLLLGETPSLRFSQGDALSKTVSPGLPEYLDFLVANDTHGANVAVHPNELSQAVQWSNLFDLAGDYRLRIGVVPANASPAFIDLDFHWTLAPTTCTIRDSNP